MSVSVRRISWSTLGLTLLGMRESNYMLTYSIGVSFTCILLVGMTKSAIQSAEVISATESVQHNNVFCNLLLFLWFTLKGTTVCNNTLWGRTEENWGDFTQALQHILTNQAWKPIYMSLSRGESPQSLQTKPNRLYANDAKFAMMHIIHLMFQLLIKILKIQVFVVNPKNFTCSIKDFSESYLEENVSILMGASSFLLS